MAIAALVVSVPPLPWLACSVNAYPSRCIMVELSCNRVRVGIATFTDAKSREPSVSGGSAEDCGVGDASACDPDLLQRSAQVGERHEQGAF